MHAGNGPGLTNRPLGQKSGAETNTLLSANMPQIPMRVSSANASQSQATSGASIATAGTTSGRTFTAVDGFNTSSPNVQLNNNSVGGSSSPVNNIQPFQVVNYIIALFGTFPSRN